MKREAFSCFAVEEIVNNIQAISGSYSPYVVFYDWVKMYALSIQNACDLEHGAVWQMREQAYIETASKYKKTELSQFCKISALLADVFENNGISDYLGEVFMKSGAGSKHTGQFFTPFHVAVLTAGVRLASVDLSKKIYMNEPSTGGGGMILAAAKVLQEQGHDYQEKMEVVAQDLDWLGVYMTYIQLSLVGISAIVAQGDTLAEAYKSGHPEERILRTPKKMGMIL